MLICTGKSTNRPLFVPSLCLCAAGAGDTCFGRLNGGAFPGILLILLLALLMLKDLDIILGIGQAERASTPAAERVDHCAQSLAKMKERLEADAKKMRTR